MATKKTAKKTAKKSTKKTAKEEKTSKKVVAKKRKKAAPEKVEKRGRPRKKESEKAKRKVSSTLIRAKDIPPAALKAIEKADRLEIAAADAQEAFREQLSKIPGVLGGKSFEHPERGPMSVMERGHWFWRSKPMGK